jgi:hypothetical protein
VGYSRGSQETASGANFISNGWQALTAPQIGGGLLAGAAVLGAGYAAWHAHENNQKTQEQASFHHLNSRTLPYSPSPKEQALTWGVQGWLRDAQARTEEFRNHGPRGPTTWVLVEGRENIPRPALEAGRDRDGNSIYIARAYYEEGIRTFCV